MAVNVLNGNRARDNSAPREGTLPIGHVLGWLSCGVVLLLVYHSELLGLWRVWMTDQDYSHGVLVGPIAAYLAWWNLRRRGEVHVESTWLSIALGAGFLLAAHLLRVYGLLHWYDSARRLSFVIALWGLVTLLFGLRITKLLAVPLLFLLLMLPPPGRVALAITLPLRRMVAMAATVVLNVMGWDAVRAGNTITLPTQAFGVARACSGLRMVFAMATLGVAAVVTFLAHRPLWERIALVLAMIPIALAVNVGRVVAVGIVAEVSAGDIPVARIDQWAGWLTMPAALALLWVEYRFLRALLVTHVGPSE